MKEALIRAREQALQYWQARNPRERLLLAGGGALLLVAIYIASLQAVNARIDLLAKRLPGLMLASYEIAAGTRGAPPPRRSEEDLRSELFRLLAEKDIKAELRALAPDRVEMRIASGNGATIIEQINTLRLAASARVASLNLRSEEAGGDAEVTVILERRR